MSSARISEFVPTVSRGKDGYCRIRWNTPSGDMPRDGAIMVAPEMIAEWIRTTNALVDAERLLGLRK